MLFVSCLSILVAGLSLTEADNESRPRNCEDVLEGGFRKSGVYTIFPSGSGIKVACDMETDGGGWIVFQRRQEPLSGDCETSFQRSWEEYANGFGNPEGSFWLGLHNIHNITSSEPHQLRIDLMDWEGEERYASYGTFVVGSETDQFNLTIGAHSGDAGDPMGYHNGMKFTTLDRDNDQRSGQCAHIWHGGWWYNACLHASLNGLYVPGGKDFVAYDGVVWGTWYTGAVSMKRAEMKIRSWDFVNRQVATH